MLKKTMWTKEEIQNITKNARKRGNVLMELMKSSNKKDWVIAEIGVWNSKSTKQILRGCGDIISQYWAVDFWHPSDHPSYRDIITEEWDKLHFYACRLMYWFPQLHVVRMSSLEAAKIFPKKYFDLVFIDADHTYESVTQDIEAWAPLIKEGGLITGHDYNRSHPGVVKAVTGCLGEIIKAPDLVWIKQL